jgi:hypothetical protein
MGLTEPQRFVRNVQNSNVNEVFSGAAVSACSTMSPILLGSSLCSRLHVRLVGITQFSFQSFTVN